VVLLAELLISKNAFVQNRIYMFRNEEEKCHARGSVAFFLQVPYPFCQLIYPAQLDGYRRAVDENAFAV
jgi:hypothetical protein